MYIVLDNINGKPVGSAKLLTDDEYKNSCKCTKTGISPYIVLTFEQLEKLPDEMVTDKKLKQYVKKLKKNG